jgi:hypothetical protein
MTVPSGTFQTFQAIGNKEDITDVIYTISPMETPFLSMAARTTAKARYHEWQTDALASAAANAAIEGDDATINTAVPTVRLNNYNQILTKAVSVSGTQEIVNKAGRNGEMAYQIAKRSKELKRDLELALTQNQDSTAGGAAAAAEMGSLESWLFTNRTTLGATIAAATTPGYASGEVGSPVDASVAGTFTKTALDKIIQECWTQGGDPKIIMTGPFNKTKLSAFTGIATLYKEVPGLKQGTIVGGADVYISNFGEHTVVPNRFCRDKTVTILDMDYWAVAYLRPWTQFALAKTGDSEKRQLLVECTLVSRNEAASGKITDLLTT